jgi:pimeloyl-ACP methyl ester carboxylesterase
VRIGNSLETRTLQANDIPKRELSRLPKSRLEIIDESSLKDFLRLPSCPKWFNGATSLTLPKKVGKPKLPYASERGDIINIESRAGEIVVSWQRKNQMNANPATAPTPNPQSIEDHWITLDGARMRFLRSGDGPPLLLLHGLLGYSFSWRHAIPVLSQHATVHAVDMLGVGFSDRPAGLDSTLRASAERLLLFLDSVGVESCDLLGTSHGGAVSMMAASLAPDRIRSLILVAPVNPWSRTGAAMAALLSSRPVAPVFLRLAPHLNFTHDYLLRRLYGNPRHIRPGTLDGYTAPFAIPGLFEHSLKILRTWSRDLDELRSALPHIAHIPTLLLWGSADAAVDPASAVPLSRQFQNCQVRNFAGVGHLPYEEVPDEFNRAVSEFLVKSHSHLSNIAAR